jgi:hypothetical protein
MSDRTRLSRLITLALASCAMTWAFAASSFARPDATAATTTAAPAFKVVAGDTDKAPSASAAPAYQPAIGDRLKAPDRAAVDSNLAGISHGGKTPGHVVVATNGDFDTIGLMSAIVALLLATAAVTFIVVRPQRPVLRT